MKNLNELINRIARDPSSLTDDDIAELARACRAYPASAVAPALMLRYGSSRLSESERDELRTRVALLGGDREKLIAMTDPSGQGFNDFYPPEPEVRKPDTTNAIDTFLETYGHRSPEEDALLERMIFNPVPDYSEQLARTERPAPATTTQESLIDAFLAANPADDSFGLEIEPEHAAAASAPSDVPAAVGATRPAEPAPSQDSLLSESLAKIFIKQGRYDRAYEIISNLNLNYPGKSIYFADQLRFLRKLMVNQSHGTAPEAGQQTIQDNHR